MNTNVKTGRILVVDDEPSVCDLIGRALAVQDMPCALVTEPTAVDALLAQERFDAILCDVAMPEMSGLDLLRLARDRQPETPVILMTGGASIEEAKHAIRRGAYDYLEKPLAVDRLCRILQRAIAEAPARRPEADEPSAPGDRDALTGLISPRRLHERLSDIRLNSVADRRNCAMMVIDIDAFAEINSIFGYAFGDGILRALAERLETIFPASAALCRPGGDRFVVLLADADEEQAAEIAEQARRTAATLQMTWRNRPIALTTSVGVAEAGPGFGLPEDQLLANARWALREAKRAGGDAVGRYSRLARGGSGKVDLVAAELHRVAQEASKIDHELRLACLESVRALVSAVEAKDPYTRRHSDQVAYYAEHLARFVDLPGDSIETIRVAAMVHDVGKIGVPDTILTKPGRLTDEEYALIKEHPAMGAEILSKISMLATESRLILAHHENWNGSGYPAGLAGEQIPFGARILQLADCIDAMLMRRTYKEPLPLPRVIEELRKGRGGQFDPALADVACRWLTTHPDKIIQPAA